MTLRPAGMHHVSAVTAHIGRTDTFYTDVLGMHRVIRTVNQDDPTMYHLFYGDGAGTPGSDMTMFDIPHVVRERRGNNSITRTTLRVAGESALAYWAARLDDVGVAHEGVTERDGRAVLDFDDSEGTQLSLIDDGGAGDAFPWERSNVPPECQVRGLGYVEFTVPVLEPTRHFMEVLGLRHDHSYAGAGGTVHVYLMNTAGAQGEVHVAVRDDLAPARHGAGGVHHFAVRVPAEQDIHAWADHLDAAGFPNSGVVDRHYFQSVYVREPNHVLFELATDGPGFAVDGPLDGERLSLPPFLEPRRADIEAKLKPIVS